MPKEAYAEQIKNSALEKICRRPDRSDGFHGWLFALQLHFQTHPLFPLDGEQLVNHFKPWLAGVKVSASQIGEKIDKTLGFEPRAGIADGFARHIDRKLVAIQLGAAHRACVPCEQRSQHWLFFKLLEICYGGPSPRQTPHLVSPIHSTSGVCTL